MNEKKFNCFEKAEYYNIIKDMIETEKVKSMDNFIQHGSTTTLEHCISVSYASYRIAKKLKLDYISVARAGLLHDFFLYDWHKLPPEKRLFKKHGFTHPGIALKNAQEQFHLNKKEKDIIIKHMWPLTFTKVPRYKESILVSLVDKYISTKETIKNILNK